MTAVAVRCLKYTASRNSAVMSSKASPPSIASEVAELPSADRTAKKIAEVIPATSNEEVATAITSSASVKPRNRRNGLVKCVFVFPISAHRKASDEDTPPPCPHKSRFILRA